MSTKIAVSFLKEIGLMLVRKVAWKVVVERLITRLIVDGARALARMSTNTVDDEAVEDIISGLKGKQLKVIDEL